MTKKLTYVLIDLFTLYVMITPKYFMNSSLHDIMDIWTVRQ